MAIHYNLSKVYEISDNDPEFVLQIVHLFVDEIPNDITSLKDMIDEGDHKKAYSFSHKIKPTLDLFGLDLAYDENKQIDLWTKTEGRRREIKETFKSMENRIEKVVKELKKDFSI